MTPSDSPADRNAQAVQAMRSGNVPEARAILEAALATHPLDIALWLNLAAACRAAGEIDASLAAVEGALRVEPRSFLALLMKASLLERKGLTREAGVGYGIALTQAPDPDLLDAPTRRALDHGRRFHADYLQGLRVRLAGAVSDARAPGRSVEGRRIGLFIEHLLGARRIYHQKPTAFFYPGLPSIEFYPREDFPWLTPIEAATDAIRSELFAVAPHNQLTEAFTPYVAYPDGVPLDQWAELNHSPRWSAYFLFKGGEPTADALARCPATLEALAGAPQPLVRRRTPSGMFSVLQPRTRIPPHTGVSNTRLVAHLPMIIPADCGFRVGNESRPWRDGEAWVFDDTLEHEAWNNSSQPRTILIFDIWSPFLSAVERDLITRVTAAADDFNDGGLEFGL